MSDPQLMKYLGLDKSDLNANRNGSLSPKQNARLADAFSAQRQARAYRRCGSLRRGWEAVGMTNDSYNRTEKTYG